MKVSNFLRAERPVPPDHRRVFRHLYFDIAWYGVLAGSALAFVAVFAARQGAGAFEIGLLNAGPAAVSLLLTLPAGRWLEARPLNSGVFWTAVLFRLGYLLWPLLPFFLPPRAQIGALILITLSMNVPGTALAVGFNALFAASVPPEWRSHVAGIRNSILAAVTIVTSLGCGQLLDRLPFPVGYQVVFGIGCLGAAMSTVHLWFVRPQEEPAPSRTRRRLRERVHLARHRLRHVPGLRGLLRPEGRRLSLKILRGPFGRLLVLLFAFHLTHHLPSALFPIQMVETLRLTDAQISLGSALFQVAVFFGSLQLDTLSQRIGHRRVAGLGALLLSAYPILLGSARGPALFLVASAVGGTAWSLVGGALVNFLLEEIPAEKRPSYLSWYHLVFNAAIMLGSLLGPLGARWLGLVPALFVCAGLRILTALPLWRARLQPIPSLPSREGQPYDLLTKG